MKRKINKIVIHCSDSDIPAHDNIKTITEWHTQRGFTGPDDKPGTKDDIGYHWLIVQDGGMYPGRDEEAIGAHVQGHNSDSIGICLTGGKKTVASPLQRKSLEYLLRILTQRYNLTKLDIVGHRDLNPGKSCPIFDLQAFLAALPWH